jgi:hypothetical protein
MHTRHKYTKKNKSMRKHRSSRKHKSMRKYKSIRKRLNKRKHMKGGFGVGAGPLGYSWIGKDVNTWPGVRGVAGQSNFLPLSEDGITAGLPKQPINTSELNMTNRQTGGGLTDLLPQDLVNFGRSLTGGVQGAIYGYNGVERPNYTYPSPTTQHVMNENYKYIDSSPPNIKNIHVMAGNKVANL